MTEHPTLLIVAGGTGGHLYPGIAVARELRKRPDPVSVSFIVKRGDLGRGVLEKEQFPVIEVEGQGFPRQFGLKMFSFPGKLLKSFLESRRVLRTHRPSVILGMGGYLSFPVLLQAKGMGIPTLIHEQNVLPGLTNRILSRVATSVAISFPESDRYFPKEKTWLSGLPIRGEIGTVDKFKARRALGLSESKLTFLIFGGSLGAHRLNQVMLAVWKKLLPLSDSFQVLHITGEKEYASVEASYGGMTALSATVLPYCHQMPEAYASADLVICRSGASTVAELWAARRPAVLIPYPYASGNHQLHNARFLEGRNVADVVIEKDIDSNTFATKLKEYIENPRLLQQRANQFADRTEAEPGTGPAQKLADFIAHLVR